MVGADVVVVGMGAGGAIAADVLARAGLAVVGLEAGPRYSHEQMTPDEIRNEVDHWLAAPKSAGEIPTYRPDAGTDAVPSPYPTLMVNGVGGAAVHYAGTSPRLHPWNFRARSATLDRYGKDAIPAGSTLADWPLDYDELEPYYAHVEHAIGVSGEGSNPFEGPRSRGYPMPPLRRSGWTELMADAARRLGWHPFPLPAAINSEPYDGRPACTYCGFCENTGCHNGAKGSPGDSVVPRAEATGNLSLVTGARVTGVRVDDAGRPSGVEYVGPDGRAIEQDAAVVLLAASTYENVRLLLRSVPRVNAAGQVGLGFMPHINPEVYGVFDGIDLRLWSGSWAQGVGIDDFNADNFDHAGLGFVSGGMLTAAHELLKPIALSRLVPPGRPRWGSAWKAWLRANARSVGVAMGQLDVLPYEGNALDLDPVATDAFGLPRVRVTYRPRERELRARAFMVERLTEWLRAAGAGETWTAAGESIELRTAYGGARMGDDAASSVVDRFGFTHGVGNLGVIGASTFPTTGGHNPTLTLQALAWRTAQRVVDDWDAIAGAG
jgi:gluconate 2-dehydrogenase alpha chain